VTYNSKETTYNLAAIGAVVAIVPVITPMVARTDSYDHLCICRSAHCTQRDQHTQSKNPTREASLHGILHNLHLQNYLHSSRIRISLTTLYWQQFFIILNIPKPNQALKVNLTTPRRLAIRHVEPSHPKNRILLIFDLIFELRKTMRHSVSLALATLFLPAWSPAGVLHAQGIPAIQVETHLIDTTLSVHDADGRIVTGLTRDDFTVVEDGVPQKIRFFAHDTQLPLSIGLIIDESGSQEKFVKEHEKDIETFLHQVLEPNDQAFAVCFGNHLRLVSDSTSSAPVIMDGIRSFDKGNVDFPEIGPKEERELGTALYDAIFYGVKDKLVSIHQRRKVLVVFSDGEENSSEHDLLDAIEAAQNADVLVYAIRYTELKHRKMDARDRYGVRALDHLTTQTGGKAFDFHATNLKQAFAEISRDLRSLYDLAYQSTNPVRDGTYRKVMIQTTRPDLIVRARAGYYAR
jgi:Ca-activated chloride channel family protein